MHCFEGVPMNEVGLVASLSNKQGRHHKYIVSTCTLHLESIARSINITWSQTILIVLV